MGEVYEVGEGVLGYGVESAVIHIYEYLKCETESKSYYSITSSSGYEICSIAYLGMARCMCMNLKNHH